jgi:hypothetical protein
MTILDEIAYTYKRLKRAKERLQDFEMAQDTPRSSVFSDTPKGAWNVSNPLEDNYIRKEELINKCKEIEARLEKQWHKAVAQMTAAQINEQVREMLFLRFVRGWQWEKCATKLNEDYPNRHWNTNKCFREYRNAVIKLRHY